MQNKLEPMDGTTCAVPSGIGVRDVDYGRQLKRFLKAVHRTTIYCNYCVNADVILPSLPRLQTPYCCPSPATTCSGTADAMCVTVGAFDVVQGGRPDHGHPGEGLLMAFS